MLFRLFPGGALVVKAKQVDQKEVLTQQEMCDIFLPIMRSQGTLVQKVGRRLARRAHQGEEVGRQCSFRSFSSSNFLFVSFSFLFDYGDYYLYLFSTYLVFIVISL